MAELTTIGPAHLRREAWVYVRQSTMTQVRENTESLKRQYELVERAHRLGWPADRVRVIDDDLGCSGAEATARVGFQGLVAAVGLGQVGLVLGIEVSRLARRNADWYHLLDLCAMTDTLIADADGLYHPGDYNDRLVLGLKGTMSEAELHVLRSRLDAGLRHKATRGELRQLLPVGLDYDEDGRIVVSPDEAVRAAIVAVFDRFDELGSARQVVLSLRADGLRLPRRSAGGYQPIMCFGLKARPPLLKPRRGAQRRGEPGYQPGLGQALHQFLAVQGQVRAGADENVRSRHFKLVS